jgi:adenylate kinase family enzyme
MRRILVIGSGGSGKSTLTRKLGEKLCLPVIHLDALYWSPGWKEHNPLTWPATVEQACSSESWVMDGNYSGTLVQRLPRADTVVYLDMPRWFCIRNIVLRSIHNLGRSRDDLGEGCPEGPDLEFMRWVWNYPTRSRARVLAMIEEHGAHCERHVFRSWRESDAWMDSLPS